jgi:hypothetical protein
LQSDVADVVPSVSEGVRVDGHIEAQRARCVLIAGERRFPRRFRRSSFGATWAGTVRFVCSERSSSWLASRCPKPHDMGPSTLGRALRDGQTCRMHTADRFFSIVDPSRRRLVGLCAGPDDDGSCPTTAEGALPCEGRQVIPLRGTPVDGLPFTVTAAPSPVCPLAWIDSASSPKVR